MTLKTYITILFIAFTSFAFCQAPGYMGKKLTLTYDPAFFPSWIDFDQEFDDIPLMGIHFRHDITATYTISTGVTIGFTYKYLPTHYYNVLQTNIENSEGFYGDIRRITSCYGVILQNFSYLKRGSIAPVGRYKSFELFMARNSFKTLSMENYPGIDMIPFEDLNADIPMNPLFVFVFGSGVQSVIKDRLLMQYGWEIGVSLDPGMLFIFDNAEGKAGITFDNEDPQDISDFFRSTLYGPFFLNFSIGGGYLFNH